MAQTAGQFREEANVAKVHLDSVWFDGHHGITVGNETGCGDKIEQWEGYVALVMKVMETLPSWPVRREGWGP